MTYWLHLFTWNTWQEFLDADGHVTGFRESRLNRVQSIKPGDVFVCYMIGISRFFALLEVTGEPYQDDTLIWTQAVLPARVPVRIVMDLPPEFAVPVQSLRDSLSYFQNMSHPTAWAGHFRQSPAAMADDDALAVIGALEDAQDNPVFLEYDRRRLERSRIPVYESGSGYNVTIPADNAENTEQQIARPEIGGATHDEIQWRLLHMGAQMGLDVWVAKNDWSRSYNNQLFREMSRVRHALPMQFDEATHRTIELIDVLWLQNNTIVAAFEVEHTSTVYSGLLRMSDLVSMQPNININLFIVGPDSRREKVRSEINRPTFSRLTPPLTQVCRFIPYSALIERFNQLNDMLRYVKPSFLDEIAETLEIDFT